MGLAKIDSDGDELESLPSNEDDPMNIENLIHDGPPPMVGLELLAAVAPAPSKNVSCVKKIGVNLLSK